LVLRLAALLFGVGAPGLINNATRQGFKTVRGYAPFSANVAAEAFQAIGLSGEVRECALELIRQHEYLFDQVLQFTSSDPIPKLCQRWRKKLGPLWKQHFELAETLWDGQVL